MTELMLATPLTKPELQAPTKPELKAVHRTRFLANVCVIRQDQDAIAAERDAEASLN
jgi:hypothetical protein